MTIEDRSPNTVFDSPRSLLSEEMHPAQFEAAFTEVLGHQREDVAVYAMRYALALTRGDKHDAEDLVQDAIVRLLKCTFDGPVNGRAYVATILLNLHRDRLRRRQTQTDKLGARTGFDIAVDEGVQERTDENPADTVVESVFSSEIRDRVEALVGSVPNEDQRIVLAAMLDLDNGELRSCRDIESLTGFSNSKVKRLRAAVGPRLAEALADLAGRNDPHSLP